MLCPQTLSAAVVIHPVPRLIHVWTQIWGCFANHVEGDSSGGNPVQLIAGPKALSRFVTRRGP